MFINDDLQIIKYISEFFDKIITEENGNVKINREKVENIFDFILKNFMLIEENGKAINGKEQRKLVFRRLYWFYSKILIISIHDNACIHTIQIRQLLDKMMQRSLSNFMYWFKSFVDFHLIMLKTTITHNLTKSPLEIIVPGSEMEGNLNFSKIIIKTDTQVDNLISLSFQTLSRAIDVFPACIRTLEVSIQELILLVFLNRNLESKNAAILFCEKYYTHVYSLDFIDVSIRIFRHLSTIYEHLNEYIESQLICRRFFVEIFLKSFHKYLEMYVNHFKELNEQIMDPITTDSLIATLIRLIFFESKWIKQYSVPALTHWYTEILDLIFLTTNYDQKIIRHIDIVNQLAKTNSSVLHILKYKIILEIENSQDFNRKIHLMSKTWLEIQNELAFKTNILLNSQKISNEEFVEHLQWIKDAVQITFDIDFHFTRRHQISHCLHYVCNYAQYPKLDAINNIYKFDDWDYDHIYLDFFSDLPSITHKLTLAVSKRTEFTVEMLSILIKLFSLILQIPSTTLIKDDKKLMLLATVISPFLLSFDKHENIGKSKEYTKIHTYVNLKMKKFLIEFSADTHSLNKLKFETISGLTLLRFSKLGKTFEWLHFNLMQIILKKEDKVIQRSYVSKFINLLMTNFDTMATYLLHYQNIRLNNTNLELEEVKNILCLHDKNVVIVRFMTFDYHVFCSDCDKQAVNRIVTAIQGDDSKSNQRHAYIMDKKACIISSNFIDTKDVKLQINPNILKDKDVLFITEFIRNIPACVKHAKSFTDFCLNDQFLNVLFKRDDQILAQADYHLQNIITSIQKSTLKDEAKNVFFGKMLQQLFEMTLEYSQKSNVPKIQYHVVNLVATFGKTVRSNLSSYDNKYIEDVERISLKCLKLLVYFIILNESDVKGVAVNSMHRMLEHNELVLHIFFNWYKTNILEHVIRLCLLNSLGDSTHQVFLNSFFNTLKHFNFSDILKFLKSNIDIIIASIFAFCVQHNKMQNIYCIIDQCGYSVRQALEISCLSLYDKVYNLEKRKKENCINLMSKEMSVTFKDLFQNTRRNVLQDVLIKYHQNPIFVVDVIKLLGDENVNLVDDDGIANYISNGFLGVLNNFERILNSSDSEKTLKQAILQSLGDLIRFLGGRRISNLCFKIMSLLRTTVTTNHTKLKELSLSVWKILIFNCDISLLGPFLSQILVALEGFMPEFSEQVYDICIYLIFENVNLLSTHISDLFFIEKTSFDTAIKNAVLNQIESQRVADGNDFVINLNLMIKHLRNEHADSNVKIYCLQYLQEFIERNRKKFNNLIFGSGELDTAIIYLLDVLTACSKSFHNKKLQIQTAKCFGELGALKPALKKQKFLSKKIEQSEMTIHSDNFALKLLKIYCSYYKDMKETRHMESMALAIQAILQERQVNATHEIWNQLPEFTRELFKPLLNSSYVPREIKISNNETIFWNQAQTATYWAYLLSALLIESIDAEETRLLLRNLLPSMRENQEISSLLLPRIILHYFLTNTSEEHDKIIYEEFELVFKMVMDNTIYSDASKDELNYKFVASFDFTPIERKEKEDCQNKVLSVSVKTAKMIFSVWDFLTRYLQIEDNLKLTTRIETLLNRFSKKRLAEVNFKCGEYERAMILFEAYLKTLDKNEMENELSFLVNIYAKLKDSDLIAGVKALRITEWSLSDKIFISEITGNLEGTFSYIEMMMKGSSFSQEEIQSIINCYIQSNQISTALLVGEQMLEKLYNSNQEHPYCDEIKAEALWRLSKFDEFEELIASDKINDRNNWNVICGKLLTKFRLENGNDFWQELENARISIMHNFKISNLDDAIYQDNYNEIFHLHILTEFEKFQLAFEDVQKNVNEKKNFINVVKILKNLLKELDSRKTLLQTSTSIIELSLSLRRSLLLQLLNSKLVRLFNDEEFVQISRLIEEEVGKTWIECAKIACKQKMLNQAYAYMMEADVYNPPELFIEKAKYYWMKEEKGSTSLRILELNCAEIEKYCKTNNSNNKRSSASDIRDKQLLLSRARLDIARYNAEMKNVDFDTNKALFKDALLKPPYDVQSSQNEEIYVLLAEYMDRHYFSKCSKNDLPEYDKLFEIIQAYGSSMKYGMNYVLQSMPRFLQIWFDAMASLERKSTSTSKNNIKTRGEEEIEQKINIYVREIVKVLKPYYFYTAFSQLISRLCHPSFGVYTQLKTIIAKLIEEYPLESMWFIMPNASCKSEFRKKRAIEILNSFSKDQKRFLNFNAVMEKIMTLAQRKTVDKEFMASFCSVTEKLFKNVSILMPLQKHLQMVQPTSSDNLFSSSANSQVLISKIHEKVEIMRSLQQPKKITFVGSDGKEYPMLLKFKDDLRIDFRFMEFLKVVNDYFNKDPDASQRCLSVRTYSVIPWNEDMGIIEWIPNLNTFKGVVTEQYKKSRFKTPATPELRKLYDEWAGTTNKIKFFEGMKAKYPPILGRWYLHHFSTVQNYFKARQNYIRSLAIMSMVGYIIGLGDRHMENILFDLHSGEIVHVDFACIFNKGENLGFPETVPFRLTHHMIDAMGPLGIEGPFKKCCEVSLQLMQREKNTLISYLRPFIYDPMIRKKSHHGEQTEAVDTEAMANLQRVEKKLQGIVKKYKGITEIALSSEGQVKFIIDEAISDENLSVMYFHWNPYI